MSTYIIYTFTFNNDYYYYIYIYIYNNIQQSIIYENRPKKRLDTAQTPGNSFITRIPEIRPRPPALLKKLSRENLTGKETRTRSSVSHTLFPSWHYSKSSDYWAPLLPWSAATALSCNTPIPFS